MKKTSLMIIILSSLLFSCKKDIETPNTERNDQVLIQLEVQHENGSSTFSEIYRIQ